MKKHSKIVKRVVWAVAVLVTVTVLFYTVERWRGARAWAAVEAYLQGEGETLTFSELRPEPVAEEDNLCAVPMLAALVDFSVPEGGGEAVYGDAKSRERFLEMRLPAGDGEKEAPPLPDAAEGRAMDLKAWAEYLAPEGFEVGDAAADAAGQIRNALARYDAGFGEIAEAAESRSGAWFPLKMGEGFADMVTTPLPHFSDVLGFSRFLAVKGAAAAAGGDGATAKRCVAMQIKLAEAVAAEPILIGHLVGVTITGHAVAVVREGLLAGVWDEVELERIGEMLGGIDCYARGAHAMRGEMTGFFIGGVSFLKSADGREWGMVSGDAGGSSLGYSLIPDGWLDQNAARGCELMYRNAILPLKNRNLRVVAENSISDELRSATPYNFLVRLILPSAEAVIKRTGQAQVMVDAARAGCALERYRLKNGGYPDGLEALRPEYLEEVPADPMGGGSLQYKREKEAYRIYSVGLDGKDDGGALVLGEDGKIKRDEGDWVWIGGAMEE